MKLPKRKKQPTRYAIQWRFRSSTRWNLYRVHPNEEIARRECPADTEARIFRVVPRRAKIKSKLTSAKRGARNRRSTMRELWSMARAACMERDQGRCQKCDAGADEAHHVIGRRLLRTRYDVMNLLALCKKCHDAWHARPMSYYLWFARTWPERTAHLEAIERDVASLEAKVSVTEVRMGPGAASSLAGVGDHEGS